MRRFILLSLLAKRDGATCPLDVLGSNKFKVKKVTGMFTFAVPE